MMDGGDVTRHGIWAMDVETKTVERCEMLPQRIASWVDSGIAVVY
jgi:hypothetical protein